MRTLTVIVATFVLSACASQAPAPQKAAAPAEKKAPQCWNGDSAKFENVGTKTKISGVPVECKMTSDGKAAQWMGMKH